MSAPLSSDLQEFHLGRLKNRRDFVRMKSGKRYNTPLFTLQVRKSEMQHDDNSVAPSRIGFTVTKKVGNAVERNRIKRRLRSAATLAIVASGQPATDYCVIARRACLTAPYDAILHDFKQALDHLHANRAKGSRKPQKLASRDS